MIFVKYLTHNNKIIYEVSIVSVKQVKLSYEKFLLISRHTKVIRVPLYYKTNNSLEHYYKSF